MFYKFCDFFTLFCCNKTYYSNYKKLFVIFWVFACFFFSSEYFSFQASSYQKIKKSALVVVQTSFADSKPFNYNFFFSSKFIKNKQFFKTCKNNSKLNQEKLCSIPSFCFQKAFNSFVIDYPSSFVLSSKPNLNLNFLLSHTYTPNSSFFLSSCRIRPLYCNSCSSASSFSNPKKAENNKREENFDNLKTKKVFFFPGQGAQYIGMGLSTAKRYANAKLLYLKASDILGLDLLDLCENGPKEILDKTDICQPAIFVASMAAVEKLKEDFGEESEGDVSLGLSLGEYSALCYSGGITFEQGVMLTRERGKSMQKCADNNLCKTGMISVIGLNKSDTFNMCAYIKNNFNEDIYLANFLCDGNYVLSGSIEGCNAVEKVAKSIFNARMCIRLSVAGAFHTKYMQNAVPSFSEFLTKKCIINTPRIPIISNVDAKPHCNAEVIKELLIKQITNPVLLEDSIKYVFERGYEIGYEIGPGKVIKGVVKRIDKNKNIQNIE